MGRRIMMVVGSPNERGNTRTVVDWVAEGARQAGADVEIVDAARLRYEVYGCQACMACKGAKEFRCAVDDEATDVIARMPEQDAVVLATPIYFWGLSAQLKHVVDRMFCLVKSDERGYRFAPGLEKARLAFVATAGGGSEWGLKLAEENVKAIAGFVGVGAPAFKSLLVPNAHSEEGVRESNTALREKARAFGRELAG
ncbi:MAG: flavodoxin family protein [Candidatus Eisenbacteria bacterium]|nr:flavodoxin family protein [Candidatus Eisenbacteria bacterium]